MFQKIKRKLLAFIDQRAEALPGQIEAGTYKGDLAQGDRRAFAEAEWPVAAYPTLYANVPADIRRPLVWDGRILGGREVGWLVWNHLTPAVLVETARSSGRIALFSALAFTAALVFLVLNGKVFPYINLGLLTELFSTPVGGFVRMIGLLGFAFTAWFMGFAASKTFAFLGFHQPKLHTACYVVSFAWQYLAISGPLAIFSVGGFISDFGGGSFDPILTNWPEFPAWAWEIGAIGPIIGWVAYVAVRGIITAAIFIGFPIAAGLLTLYAFRYYGFWNTLNVWAAETGKPYSTPTRDALLIYKARSDGSRAAEYRAYARQVEDAAGRLASLPLIPLGEATGLLRARGDMKAPTKGQLVAYDGESIRNHTLVLGDTGTGKTRDVLRPLFRRIMNAPWGKGHAIGAYVTDGKGTLWRDLLPAVAHRDDVRVIGTGPDHYGVDLLAGMTPLEVSSTFKAVAGQVAGKPSDDFWGESASLLLMHAATVAEILDRDQESADFAGCRPYSLAGIAKIATNEEIMQRSTARVRELSAKKAGEISNSLFNAVGAGFDSVVWLDGTYSPMATETKSGITANVNVVLGKLSGAGDLAERFTRGTYEDAIDVDHALNGGVLMIAIGDTEYGMAGRVISTWLKQRLYVLAKRRLVTDPEACASSSCALIADEFQMLVTAGQDSDTTFWNVARESGVFLVAATQSVAALKQTIGHEQTANLLNLLRNKIVLSTGEVETIDYIKKLAGDLPQGWEPDTHFYCTQAMREAANPSVSTPVVPRLPLPTWPALDTPVMDTAAKLDQRFVPNTQSPESHSSALAQATWRHEDKSKETLVSSLNWLPKVRHDELRNGQGIAFAMIYRAGVDRADIIDLRSV